MAGARMRRCRAASSSCSNRQVTFHRWRIQKAPSARSGTSSSANRPPTPTRNASVNCCAAAAGRPSVADDATCQDRTVESPYEEMASAYAHHAGDSPYNAHYDRPAVLALIGDVDGRRVLDAG